MQAWIEPETRTSDFGDERLNRRYALLLDSLSAQPSLSIPAACRGLAETTAAYRFFDNDRVTPEKVLRPHQDATLQRVQAESVVLAAQDTTEVDLTRKKERVGGPLNDAARWGVLVHPLLVMTPQRVPLGVMAAEMWSRDAEEFAKSQEEKRYERKHKAIEDKESHRWLKGYRQACVLAERAPHTQVICLSDSEGDIYECFLEPTQGTGRKANWIVRACQDRAVVGGTAHLTQTVASAPVMGELTIQVSAREATSSDPRKKRRQSRTAREAVVTVQATAVTLQPPSRPDRQLPPVTVNAILVREKDPPSGEEPIEWLLLTDLPIGTFAEVCQVIGNYGGRWEIEIYFRVLKSGCKIEELQLEEEDRVQACLALYLIVAWRVLFLLMLGQKCPNLSCEAVLTEEEWKSVYVIVKKKKTPQTPPSLAEMVAMIASLGGYLGRKHDGPPGPKTMWIGLQRTRDFAAAWTAFGPAPS